MDPTETQTRPPNEAQQLSNMADLLERLDWRACAKDRPGHFALANRLLEAGVRFERGANGTT